MRTSPRTGHPPPERAQLPGGEQIDLVPLAEEIARRHLAEFPDEVARYGEAGFEWCVHDNRHILSWAALELEGIGDLESQLAWLARILDARDYPVERLARGLEIAAEVAQGDLAVVLLQGAGFVRSRRD